MASVPGDLTPDRCGSSLCQTPGWLHACGCRKRAWRHSRRPALVGAAPVPEPRLARHAGRTSARRVPLLPGRRTGPCCWDVAATSTSLGLSSPPGRRRTSASIRLYAGRDRRLRQGAVRATGRRPTLPLASGPSCGSATSPAGRPGRSSTPSRRSPPGGWPGSPRRSTPTRSRPCSRAATGGRPMAGATSPCSCSSPPRAALRRGRLACAWRTSTGGPGSSSSGARAPRSSGSRCPPMSARRSPAGCAGGGPAAAPGEVITRACGRRTEGSVPEGSTPSSCRVRAGRRAQGASHRLRHTAATEMLRAGAGLTEIGQVLRHQSVLTTAIYAKVDRDGLRELACRGRPAPTAVEP